MSRTVADEGEEGRLRRSRLITLGVVLAVLVGGGFGYLAVRHDTAAHHPVTSTSVVVPDALPTLTSAPIPDSAAVATALRHGLHDPSLGSSAALVVDAATGRQLFASHAGRALPPASTVKLLTAAAALTTLSTDEPPATGVVRDGPVLYLVGGGDVTVTARTRAGYPPTATLADLAARTVATLPDLGPLRLRYDAGGWSGPVLARGWSPTYLTSGNVSRLSPLEVDEARLSGGTTAPRAADPARQAAAAFRRALTARGVEVRGRLRPGAAPAGALGIASVSAPPIPALVQRMLTNSDNDLAEALGRAVARQEGRPGTFAGAAAAVTAGVERLGVRTSGLRLYDASGLSRDDRVTPRMLVDLLRVATQRNRTLSAILAGLPVAGFTGTLADRFRHGRTRAAAGVARAKTGTLAGVNALAGQVVDADGRLLLFAFLADRVPSPTAGERALDRLATALAACGACGP